MTDKPNDHASRLAAALNQWLDCASFALMATERVLALTLFLAQDHLAAAADAAKRTQDVQDFMLQFGNHCRSAVEIARMTADQAEMLRELSDDLQRELAHFIGETTAATRLAMS